MTVAKDREAIQTEWGKMKGPYLQGYTHKHNKETNREERATSG